MNLKETNNESRGFSYRYSAKEQAEIKRLCEKYEERKEERVDKLERLRRLDRSVSARAETVSLIIGIVGALILGFGMSLIMSELGAFMGLSTVPAVIIGVTAGVVGGALAALAYPVYNFVLKRERARVAPEIKRLADELLK